MQTHQHLVNIAFCWSKPFTSQLILSINWLHKYPQAKQIQLFFQAGHNQPLSQKCIHLHMTLPTIGVECFVMTELCFGSFLMTSWDWYPVVLGPLLHDANNVLHLRVTSVSKDLENVSQCFPVKQEQKSYFFSKNIIHIIQPTM